MNIGTYKEVKDPAQNQDVALYIFPHANHHAKKFSSHYIDHP